jgi:hypothetical protein
MNRWTLKGAHHERKLKVAADSISMTTLPGLVCQVDMEDEGAAELLGLWTSGCGDWSLAITGVSELSMQHQLLCGVASLDMEMDGQSASPGAIPPT